MAIAAIAALASGAWLGSQRFLRSEEPVFTEARQTRQEGHPGLPRLVKPERGLVRVQKTSYLEAYLSTDGRTVEVWLTQGKGDCGQERLASVTTEVRGDLVIVVITQGDRPSVRVRCWEQELVRTQVQLERAVPGARVVDGTTLP